MTILGHSQALASLRRELPPVTLLLGPASIGKWTLTHHLAEHHGVAMVDRAVYPDGLSMDDARAIIAFVSRAPYGTVRLVQARLDGTRAEALTALLKTLEEPPPTARFLLTASTAVPATVISRCHVHRLGLLPDEAVRDILIADGVASHTATRAAALGRGQVRRARERLGVSDRAREQVLDILRAVSTGDRSAYQERTFAAFDASTRGMLMIWLHEASTGQWAVFSAEESYELHRNRARLRAMVLVLGQFSSAAPRLGVRAALEMFLPRA